MKKKFLSILVIICLVFGSISILVGCTPKDSGPTDTTPPSDPTDTPPPSTAIEYAQWLIDKIPSTYSVSGWLQYDEDDNYAYSKEQLSNVKTESSAYVSKDGAKTVSTVLMVTDDLNLSTQNTVVSDIRIELTASGDSYSKREFEYSTRLVAEASLSQAEYRTAACRMLLPGALLALFVEDGADIELYANRAPSRFAETGLANGEDMKDYTILTYSGYLSNESETDYIRLSLEAEVYQNKLHGISYEEVGKTNDNNFRHTGYVTYTSENATEPFSKDGYYATEKEVITAVLQGVFDNLPVSYQATVNEKVIIGSTVMPELNSYVAYEKIGQTECYYTKDSTSDKWEISESYTASGKGHIGRVYDNDAKTYKEEICPEVLCNFSSDDYTEQHVYINVVNTSYASMKQMLDYVDKAEIKFERNDACTITFTMADGEEGVELTITFIILDNVLLQTIVGSKVDSTADDSNYPEEDSAVFTLTTTTYTYNTALINEDLNSYTRENQAED